MDHSVVNYGGSLLLDIPSNGWLVKWIEKDSIPVPCGCCGGAEQKIIMIIMENAFTPRLTSNEQEPH